MVKKFRIGNMDLKDTIKIPATNNVCSKIVQEVYYATRRSADEILIAIIKISVLIGIKIGWHTTSTNSECLYYKYEWEFMSPSGTYIAKPFYAINLVDLCRSPPTNIVGITAWQTKIKSYPLVSVSIRSMVEQEGKSVLWSPHTEHDRNIFYSILLPIAPSSHAHNIG